MNKWLRLLSIVLLLAVVTTVASILAPLAYTWAVETRVPMPLRVGMLGVLGPGVGNLDTHSGLLWILATSIVTAPWFFAVALEHRRWLWVIGTVFWLGSGVLLALVIA